jgi:predicted component of type VI protein secretion system
MARLVAESGSLAGKEWKIDPGLTLGREGHNSIPMPDNRKASRDHAKVWRESPGRYAVADLGSTNGTLVNDEKVTRKALIDGDEVRVGEVAFRFLLDEDEKPKKKEVERGADRLHSVLAGEAGLSATAGSAAAGADPTAIVVKERVLQFQKKTEKGSALGWDMGQMSGMLKWGMLLGVLAVAVAIVLVLAGVIGGSGGEGE